MSIFVSERIFGTTRPIRRINTPLNQPVKSRIRPIRQPFDQTMLERIDMDVIHMRPKIRLIADQVFPISALPYTPFVARHANPRAPFCFWQCLGKRYLDQPPSGCEIGIIGRKFDHTMQVFRQHHPAMNNERMPMPHRCHRLAQQIHLPCQQVITLPLQQIDGEEICAARMPGATVIRHGGSMGESYVGCQPLASGRAQ